MTTRSHVVRLEAEVSKYTAGMGKSEVATKKVIDTATALGKAVDEVFEKSGDGKQAKELAELAAAHQKAARAAGLHYNATGELEDANKRVLTSAQASAHGLDSFSEAVYKTSFETEQAAEAQKRHYASLEKVGQVAAITGAAIMAGVAVSINAYADFEQQMSQVDAATHETAANMDLLRAASVEAGADTAFSAKEAAQGVEELAKAGVSTGDILSGGLKGSLDLAAAGNLGVGESAEIAASALTQFKLKGDKIPHLADLLAAGAGKAQGSVQDLGQALNQAGLVAASTGLSIEETTGGLAAFASAGLIGSDSGTSFKTMLMALTPNSAAAASEMNKLGISAYDSQGKFIGLSKFAGNLQESMRGLSDEQRNASMKIIFGSDAVRAANILYEQGAAGIQGWTDKVNDSGFAADTARRKQDNLRGDLEKLGGSIDTVLIQSGSGASQALRGLVQGLEDVVDIVGQVPAPVLSVATGFAAVLGGAALLGGGLITVIPKIRDTKEALEVLAPAGSKANSVLSRTGRIAAGAATGLAAVAAASAIAAPALDKILAPTGETADALEKFSGQAAQGAVSADVLNKSFQDLVEHKDGVSDFQQAISGIADPGIWGNIDNVATDTIGVLSVGLVQVQSTSEKARERFKELGTQIASLDDKKAAAAFQSMAKHTDGSSESLKRLLEFMPDYRRKLEEQAKASGYATDDQTLLNIAMGKFATSADSAASAQEAYAEAAEKSQAASEEVAKALEDIGVSASGSITDLVKFTDALINAGLLNLSARDAARGFEDAIDAVTAAVATNGTSLDINTEQGRKNQAALDAVAGAGLRVVKANAENGESQAVLQGNLQSTYDKLIASAGQFGITGDAAIALAREVLKVPPGVSIESWMNDAAKRMAEQTKGAMDAIDGRVVRTYTVAEEKTIKIIETQVRGGGYEDDPAMTALRPGSLAPKRAGGGDLDMAPGPKGIDSQLFFGAKGEHVLTASEVDLMGGQQAVYRFRANLRSGNIASHQSGGTMGVPASPHQFMPSGWNAPPASPVNVAAPFVKVLLDGKEIGAKFEVVAGNVVSDADANSRYYRKGR